MPIHHLHEPIDVFSEWLDACEAAEKGNSGNAAAEEEEDLLASGLQQRTSSKKGVDDSNNKSSYASLGLDASDDDSD